jgi:hypothetical protein
MKRLSIIVLFFIGLRVFSQGVEPHDMIKYDTLIAVTNASNNGQGTGGLSWLCRVWRPRTYFQDVAANPANKRPWHCFIPGAGEIQTGNHTTDSTNLDAYGWTWWLNHGWDGSLVLNNGTHYDCSITILQPAANTRPWYTLGLERSIVSIFKPRGGVLNVNGLSQGSYEWGCAILYANDTANDTEAMSYIKTYSNLQGVGPETFQSFDWTYTTGFGTWGSRYHGKFFGIEGTADTRNVWQISQPINATEPNSAYFSYTNYGGGGHGSSGPDGILWNWVYDPSQLNWQCVSPITNANLVTGSPANTMGSYTVDPTTGTSLFQWELRQDDTTLLGGCNPIVSAGSNQTIQLPTSSASVVGSVSYQCGHIANSVSWTQVSGPNTATISASSTNATFSGLIAGVYQFQLNVVDQQGSPGNSVVTITVLAEVPPTVSAGGPYNLILPANSLQLTGTASANNGATLTGVLWTKISGPGTQTITGNTTLTPTISSLFQGTYVFQLTATDNNGNSSSSNATIVVSTAALTNPLPIIVGAGEYQVFFLNTATKKAYGMSSNTQNIGVTSGAVAGLANLMSFPPGTAITNIFGSLHSGGALDSLGNVWMWNEGDGGQIGDGNIYPSPVLTPIKILTDTLGNPFTGITQLAAGFALNNNSMWYAIKSDGTLWTWGLTFGGMKGNGSTGDTCKRPTQIPIPGGRQAMQVCADNILMVLCTDGTVWTSGGNGGSGPGSAGFADLGYVGSGTQWLSLHQLAVSGITQIAGGSYWNYAYNSALHILYGWGSCGNYLGMNIGTGKGNPVTVPTELTNIETTLGAPISVITTNFDGTTVVLTNGQLWSWGDQAQGGRGNGVELNYADSVALAASGSTYYSFNVGFFAAQMAYLPVRLCPNKSNFQMVWGGAPFLLYTYAADSTGQLYSWGRGKTATLGNGILGPPAGGQFEQAFPNSWDVTRPTPVNPLALTTTYVSSSPGCVGTVPFSMATTCALYTIPSNTKPVPQLLITSTGNQIFINVSGSSDNVHISRYLLTQTGGTALALGVQTGLRDTITAPNGTYTFKLVTTDNGWLSDSISNSINVSQTGQPPIVSAGLPQAITLPVNAVTLTGTATGQSGATITGVLWSYVSGPVGSTITTPTSLTTGITGLVAGSYTFSLKATDSNGNTATATVTVMVNCSCFNISPPSYIKR